jgi:nucleotide-binding universal stress UspA family protein
MSLMAKITRILVPTDFSPDAQVACHLAARLATYVKAEVVVFHALPGFDLLEEMGRAGERTQVEVLNGVRNRLQEWFETAVPVEVRRFLPIEVKVRVGEAIPGIIWAAQRSGVDLVLMATHGRTGLTHFLMGSITEAVLRHIRVPMLALRLGQGERPLTEVQRILWATDLSPVSEGAWRYALKLADVFAAELVLLHVLRHAKLAGQVDDPVPPPAGRLGPSLVPLERELDRRQQVVEALGLRARRKVLVGVPAEVIVAEAHAEQVDLIVVGTHGRTGLPHALVGSVAEAVIRKAPCPVLAVKVRRDGQAKEGGVDEIAA